MSIIKNLDGGPFIMYMTRIIHAIYKLKKLFKISGPIYPHRFYKNVIEICIIECLIVFKIR